MQKWLGALALAVAFGTPVAAQQAERVLAVTGEGRVAFAPDLARVELGVGADAETPAGAIDAMSAGMAPVLASLTEAGIAPADIQTGTLNLQPIYAETDRSQPGTPPSIVGYRAESVLSVQVRDLDVLGGVLNTAVSEGANRLNGVQWDLSDRTAAEDAALAAAIADAVRKAALMAEAAGVELGPIEEIREGNGPSGGPQPMMMEARMADLPLARGEVGVTAQVTMRFALGAD